MIDDRVKDGMIEIGDPAEEPTTAQPPPRVVIEYRERGVPWMLIPPLLVISAVGAIIADHKYAPPNARFQPIAVVKAPSAPGPPNPSEAPGPGRRAILEHRTGGNSACREARRVARRRAQAGRAHDASAGQRRVNAAQAGQ